MKKLDRVLLVDDAASNYLHAMLLNKMGFAEQIDSVSNGREALEFMSNCDLENLPDLILLDIHMPYMDGFMFLENFVALSEERQEGVKLLMVTASLDPMDKIKIKKYENVIDLAHKPLSVSKMLEVGEQYF